MMIRGCAVELMYQQDTPVIEVTVCCSKGA
jgi:hypothetical protein